ncbi:uncharacterized protein [Rutidosis leptorrhynchoides]|uniref:uncharacterized protein n=1 Tax=Rutidosis leptorrhynchoides TaxID=125765 RepID=UPI003A99D118
MPSYLLASDSDSEDVRVIQFIQELGEESKVESVPCIPRVRGYIPRDRELAAQRLWNDYFADAPVYPAKKFKRERNDALGKSFTTLQKYTSAIRQLAYGLSPDALDEYLHMSEQISVLCLDNFCKCITDLYKTRYMISPTATDVARLYSAHKEKHGFKGMLSNIDCMHWEWKNCHVAYKGQYTRGDHKKPTIMLEAMASYELWIWHAFFGMVGSNNDINVFGQSPIFDALKKGTAPSAPFEVNGHQYTKGYYLADTIYPDWATLIKGVTSSDLA